MSHPNDIVDVNQLPQKIAATIHRYGLGLPALILLEAGRPLSFLGGQLLWLAQPLLALFGLGRDTGRLAQLLENPAAVRSLIDHLDTLESTS